MNAHIKSLLAKAHLEKHPDSNAVAEYFAELIIRECIKVVDETVTENQSMNIGLAMASAALIAHFGVEE